MYFGMCVGASLCLFQLPCEVVLKMAVWEGCLPFPLILVDFTQGIVGNGHDIRVKVRK